jgi:hypothetical protein
VIKSYTARYFLIGHGYSVLKTWKKKGGLLFDQEILYQDPEFFKNLSKNCGFSEASTIVPIPQNFKRSWQLGRSPAEAVARWLSGGLKIPLELELLQLEDHAYKKRRQAQLGIEERLQSKSHFKPTDQAYAFTHKLRKEARPRGVLLVDDFMTSGRTLKNAAQALTDAGFHSIHAFVLGYRPRQTEGADGSCSDDAEGSSEEVSGEASGEASAACGYTSPAPAARSAVST